MDLRTRAAGPPPDLARAARFEQRLSAPGLSLFGAQAGGRSAIEMRSFAPSFGVDEDPVCRSGNGGVAVFRNLNGMIAGGCESYVASQGRRVGRNGLIAVVVDALGNITIGGACVTCVDGVLLTA